MLRAMVLLMLLAWWGEGRAQANAESPAAASIQAATQAEVKAEMALPEALRQALAARPPEHGFSARERVARLIDFMLADDGLALEYQEQPTFGIAESYRRRRVNCLSFTLMFIALARASGMRAYAQASDDAMAMRLLNDTMYRATHVNAGIEIDGLRYTVDIGWRSIIAGRQPRMITDSQAIGLLRNNNAVEHLLQGDHAAAHAEIEAALALDPDNATIWSNAGIVHWRAGRHEAARHAYQRALALKRDHIGALSNLVVMSDAYANGTPAQELQEYRMRLQRAQASDPFSQFMIAEALGTSGRDSEAIAHYLRAIRLLPDEPRFHRGLAAAYERQGDASAARRARVRASRLEARQASRRGLRDAADDGSG